MFDDLERRFYADESVILVSQHFSQQKIVWHSFVLDVAFSPQQPVPATSKAEPTAASKAQPSATAAAKKSTAAAIAEQSTAAPPKRFSTATCRATEPTSDSADPRSHLERRVQWRAQCHRAGHFQLDLPERGRICMEHSWYEPLSHASAPVVLSIQCVGISCSVMLFSYQSKIFTLLPAGWGNNELQIYTENNALVTNGKLALTASFDGTNFLSTRLRTFGKRDFVPSVTTPNGVRIEASIQLPAGVPCSSWLAPQKSQERLRSLPTALQVARESGRHSGCWPVTARRTAAAAVHTARGRLRGRLTSWKL